MCLLVWSGSLVDCTYMDLVFVWIPSPVVVRCLQPWSDSCTWLWASVQRHGPAQGPGETFHHVRARLQFSLWSQHLMSSSFSSWSLLCSPGSFKHLWMCMPTDTTHVHTRARAHTHTHTHTHTTHLVTMKNIRALQIINSVCQFRLPCVCRPAVKTFCVRFLPKVAPQNQHYSCGSIWWIGSMSKVPMLSMASGETGLPG